MRIKSIIILLLVLLGGIYLIQLVKNIVPEAMHRFEARNGEFFIDGKPTLIVSGEMHFGRVLPEDWEARIKQAKAMGLNTVSFYLFWNLCEPREGEFTTGSRKVRII